MPLFLHTADWQIGRRYSHFEPDDAAHIAEERTAVVARIAAVASARQVDAVLVAGDVFDLQTVSDRIIRKLFAAMERYAGPWVMIPGNHDAALAESVWTRALRLGVVPPNVHLALEPGVVELPSCSTAVLCAPLTQRHTYSDTTDWFDSAATPEGWNRLGLAHGSVEGILSGEIDSANPIAATRCVTARLDYLALGDWHGFRKVNDQCAYSGTPEQDRFRANEPGFCLLVEVPPRGAPIEGGSAAGTTAAAMSTPTVEPARVGRFRWHDLDLSIAVRSDVDGICATLAVFGPDDIVQIRLSGRTDLQGQRRLKGALEEAHARTRALTQDLADLRLLPTEDDMAALQADGYLAEVIAELRDEQQEGAGQGGARLAQEALSILCSELHAGTSARPPADVPTGGGLTSRKGHADGAPA